jgi:hypothetical protein
MTSRLVAFDSAFIWMLALVFIGLFFYAQSIATISVGDVRIAAQKFASVYLAYAVLALLTAVAYTLSVIFGIFSVPSYIKPFRWEDILAAVAFVGSIYILIALLPQPFALTEEEIFGFSLPVAMILTGLRGIIENYAFIGILGYSLYRNTNNIILAMLAPSLLAALFHTYVVAPAVVYGFLDAISGLIYVTTFFAIGVFVTIHTDNIWVWNIVHFMVNAMAKYFAAVRVV